MASIACKEQSLYLIQVLFYVKCAAFLLVVLV
jgi:hypothetical protein